MYTNESLTETHEIDHEDTGICPCCGKKIPDSIFGPGYHDSGDCLQPEPIGHDTMNCGAVKSGGKYKVIVCHTYSDFNEENATVKIDFKDYHAADEYAYNISKLHNYNYVSMR